MVSKQAMFRFKLNDIDRIRQTVPLSDTGQVRSIDFIRRTG